MDSVGRHSVEGKGESEIGRSRESTDRGRLVEIAECGSDGLIVDTGNGEVGNIGTRGFVDENIVDRERQCASESALVVPLHDKTIATRGGDEE